MTDTRSELSDGLKQKWFDACDGDINSAMEVGEACLKLGLQEEDAQTKRGHFFQARRFYYKAAEASGNKDDYAYAMAALASKLEDGANAESLIMAQRAPDFVESQYVFAHELVDIAKQGSNKEDNFLSGLQKYEECLTEAITQQNMLIFNFIKEDMRNLYPTIENELDGINQHTQNAIRSSIVRSTRQIYKFDAHCMARNISQSPP